MPEHPMKRVRRDSDRTQSNANTTQSTAPNRRISGTFPKKKERGRKRSQSFTGGNGKFCTPYKYRKRPMLPTKFLLGGNICDPLNLNSLQDEETNRTVNAVTPKSSPIPTPPQRRGHIEVIIPPNIHDPLNLTSCTDDLEYEQRLASPHKRNPKRRKKKKRTSSANSSANDGMAEEKNEEEEKPEEVGEVSDGSGEARTPEKGEAAKIPEEEKEKEKEKDSPPVPAKVVRDLKLDLSPKDKKRKSLDKDALKKLRRLDSMDKIVSPVVPQPGAWLKRPTHVNRVVNVVRHGRQTGKQPVFKKRDREYQFGNYNRYYGYRNQNHEVDPRLKCFSNYRYLFLGRDILDIGCNIGHITLTVARDFGAKSVVGLDIDKKLIGIARKNIRHYVNCSDSPRDEIEAHSSRTEPGGDKFFPISMPILYGPVDVPGMAPENKGKGFPHNVTFVQGNYVLEDDTLLSTDHSQFDIILCLSVTKWMHLNWGDAGLKQAFKRMYAQLRPGGKLILEPQSWASYKHKKTLTETIYQNYNSIEFFPEKFTQFLLSSEVGFAKSEIMGHPHHFSKGFQRPIQIFTKSDLSPSQSQRSYTATPSHTITSNLSSKPVYSCLTSPYYEKDLETIEEAKNKAADMKVRDNDGDINEEKEGMERVGVGGMIYENSDPDLRMDVEPVEMEETQPKNEKDAKNNKLADVSETRYKNNVKQTVNNVTHKTGLRMERGSKKANKNLGNEGNEIATVIKEDSHPNEIRMDVESDQIGDKKTKPAESKSEVRMDGGKEGDKNPDNEGIEIFTDNKTKCQQNEVKISDKMGKNVENDGKVGESALESKSKVRMDGSKGKDDKDPDNEGIETATENEDYHQQNEVRMNVESAEIGDKKVDNDGKDLVSDLEPKSEVRMDGGGGMCDKDRDKERIDENCVIESGPPNEVVESKNEGIDTNEENKKEIERRKRGGNELKEEEVKKRKVEIKNNVSEGSRMDGGDGVNDNQKLGDICENTLEIKRRMDGETGKRGDNKRKVNDDSETNDCKKNKVENEENDEKIEDLEKQEKNKMKNENITSIDDPVSNFENTNLKIHCKTRLDNT